MKFISRTATDDDILAVVRHWVDALSREEHAAVFDALGYALAYQYDEPGPEIIRGLIEGYRSPTLFPGEVEFRVSDWLTAEGGNPRPYLRIVRHDANNTGLRGTAKLDLPLNGLPVN